MNKWSKIKEELYQQEEPLSAEELSLMKQNLNGRKAVFWWSLAFLGISLVGIGMGFWTKEFKKPNITTPFETQEERTTSIANEKPQLQTTTPAQQEKAGNKDAFYENKEKSQFSITEVSNSERLLISKNQTKSTQITTLESKNLNGFDLNLNNSILTNLKDSSVAPNSNKEETPSANPKKKRFKTRLYLGYKLALNKPGLLYNEDAQHYRFEELGQQKGLGQGLNYGIELQYQLWKFIQLGLGFEYFELQKHYAYNHRVLDVPVIDAATGNIVGYLDRTEALEVSESGVNKNGFLGVPISFYYEKDIGKNWSLGAEVRYTQYFSIYRNSIELDAQSLTLVESTNSITKNIGSVKCGLNAIYGVKPNLGLGLELNYQRFTSPVYSNSQYNWQPELLGINLQLIYKL